jgi:hypothetical protein
MRRGGRWCVGDVGWWWLKPWTLARSGGFFDREKRIRAAPLRLVNKTDIDVKVEHSPRWFKLARVHRNAFHGRERRLALLMPN